MKKLVLLSVTAFAALQVGLLEATPVTTTSPATLMQSTDKVKSLPAKSDGFLHREYNKTKRFWPVVKQDTKKAWDATKQESHKLYAKAKAKLHKSDS